MESSVPNFNKARINLNNFLDLLEGIEETLPKIKKNLYKEFKDKEKEKDKFVEEYSYDREYNEENKLIRFKMPFDKQRQMNTLIREIGKSIKIARAIPTNFFVSIISEYDAYIGNLIKEIYLNKPDIIKSLEKSLTFSEIMEFGSIDKIKEFVIEKDIETTLRKSHLEQLISLEKKFSLPLTKGLKILPEFIELTERRNLFVHCNGIVSSQYIKNCSEVKYNIKDIKVGTALYASNEYIFRAISIISELVIKLTHVLWFNIFKGQEECTPAYSSLIQTSYELLQKEKYDLCIEILPLFSESKSKSLDDITRRYLVINLAIAYKFSNQSDKCSHLLSLHDWSAVSYLFKMAERILSDDYEKAAENMKKAYLAEEFRKEFLIDWPLFKFFRETDEFKAACEDLFSQDEMNQLIISNESQERCDDNEAPSMAEVKAEVEAEAAAEAEAEAEAGKVNV